LCCWLGGWLDWVWHAADIAMAARVAVIAVVAVAVRCCRVSRGVVWWIGLFLVMAALWAVGDMRLLSFLKSSG
jgi:hypothetical protein